MRATKQPAWVVADVDTDDPRQTEQLVNGRLDIAGRGLTP